MIEILPVKFAEPAVPNMKEKSKFEDLLISEIDRNNIELNNNDIVVVTSKIVSLFENRTIERSSVKPRKRVRILAKLFRFDPITLELIFKEGPIVGVLPLQMISKDHRILEQQLKLSNDPKATIAALKEKFSKLMMVRKFKLLFDSAGIDTSNTPDGYITLLPKDPARSAKEIRKKLENKTGKKLAVIITDSLYSTRRIGSNDICIGCSGIFPLVRNEAKDDIYGKPQMGGNDLIIDSIAAFSGSVMGAANEMTPVAIIKGLKYEKWNDEEPVEKIIYYPRNTKFKGGFLTVLTTFLFKLSQWALFLKSENDTKKSNR
ncbi:MAG: coenzyme F420-0:L-glutamate ligase [Kosmotogaceae bacterium]